MVKMNSNQYIKTDYIINPPEKTITSSIGDIQTEQIDEIKNISINRG